MEYLKGGRISERMNLTEGYKRKEKKKKGKYLERNEIKYTKDTILVSFEANESQGDNSESRIVSRIFFIRREERTRFLSIYPPL